MSGADKLHLGAFDQVVDGWINTDVTPHLVLARIPGAGALLHRVGRLSSERYAAYRDGRFARLRHLDLTRRLPFPDGVLAAVYSSHTFEHLQRDAAERAIAECHRVLRPGGVLRLAVPNLDNIVAHYDPADPDAFVYGIFQGASARDNRHARHWWHYNAVSLGARLRAAGFSEVTQCDYRQGRCPDLERIEYREWSLFMEGVR
ncbi:MAG TPA: methyltransferase domain-containing protein [Solirubrobacteraceae bacterium]|nr:methyltransferase domain-containing protein [Solirubrobacteraceae bacterium]